MNKLDKDYQALLQDILDNGYNKGDRTGTGSRCVFGRQIRHKMSDGFPLLTTKKMHIGQIIKETLWFLSGSTNIKPLIDQNCHIWNGDAYKKFKNTIENNRPAGYTRPVLTEDEFVAEIRTNPEFAAKWGELGPIYGKQWRALNKFYYDNSGGTFSCGWKEDVPVDQINQIIDQLRNSPDSRRIIVNAWNVAEIDDMTLPPCHIGWQLDARELSFEERIQWVMQNTDVEMENLYITEEAYASTTPRYELSLMWNQRSVDVPLGLPYNIASYGLLLEMICKEVNMVPGELVGNLGNTHIYNNQFDGVYKQLTNIPYKLGVIDINLPSGALIAGKALTNYRLNDIHLLDYQSHDKIEFPLSN